MALWNQETENQALREEVKRLKDDLTIAREQIEKLEANERRDLSAMAMQGLLSAWQKHDCEKDPQFVSRDAVEIADALLDELRK